MNYPTCQVSDRKPHSCETHSNDLLSISDQELIETANLSDAEFDELEYQLGLRAACLGWSGDPMRQPVEVVAAIVRSLLRKRNA